MLCVWHSIFDGNTPRDNGYDCISFMSLFVSLLHLVCTFLFVCPGAVFVDSIQTAYVPGNRTGRFSGKFLWDIDACMCFFSLLSFPLCPVSLTSVFFNIFLCFVPLV